MSSQTNAKWKNLLAKLKKTGTEWENLLAELKKLFPEDREHYGRFIVTRKPTVCIVSQVLSPIGDGTHWYAIHICPSNTPSTYYNEKEITILRVDEPDDVVTELTRIVKDLEKTTTQ